ncbi:MAG: Gfo/Idh/MocA family oxidoreductase [Oscillospiraceae bacterium]|jgi:predicted dehydrogenase|nr:Gfo/Idh/MocA family oxidoreductase [Oscillospiraceae bacterium]
MDEVRLGVIGVGNIGSMHCRNIAQGKVPGMTLTCAADTNAERRGWCEETLPRGVKVFGSGGELCASGCCDAVLIATPHYSHPELAVKAFWQGLHVLCEKPAGVYSLQARDMNAAAEKSGKVFGMMFNQRTNCIYRKMREIARSGQMGAIKRVNWIITDWYRTQRYYDQGAWRATWRGEGGGVLLNQAPHQLDLLQWICGKPSAVRAFCHVGKWHAIEVEDDVTAYLEYPNGATGVFVTTTGDAPGTNRFEITFDMGKLVCENDKLTAWKLDTSEREFCKTSQGTPAHTVYDVETDGENGQHIGVLKAFAGAVLRGEELVAEGAEGLDSLLLANAMYLSAWLGETVAMPFDEQLFLRELDARRS